MEYSIAIKQIETSPNQFGQMDRAWAPDGRYPGSIAVKGMKPQL